MTRLFIVSKDNPFAQNTKIEDLKDNQIGVYGMNADTYQFEPFHIDGTYEFLQVFLGGVFQGSSPYDVKTNKEVRFVKIPYAAPVHNVWRWKIIKDKVSPKDTFSVVINVKDNYSQPMARYEEYSISVGSKNVEQIYEALAKEICNSRYFEAAADKTGIVITTKNTFHWPIDVGGKYVKGPDKCYVCNTPDVFAEELVGWSQGSGTPEQLEEWDRIYLPEKGNLSCEFDGMMPRPKMYKASENVGKTYTIYILDGANLKSAAGEPHRQTFEDRRRLIVAFENDSVAQQNAFVTAITTGLGLSLRERLVTTAFSV